MSITKEVFQAQRTELNKLFQRAIDGKCLNPEDVKPVVETRRKLMEEAFEMVFVGEFQGGKSTTFDALCDGREISPRGNMIKTSACVITARNLENPQDGEYARIVFKSEPELVLMMHEVLCDGLIKHDEKRFKEICAKPEVFCGEITDYSAYKFSSQPQPLRLSDENDRKLILDVLREEWECYRRDRSAYSKLDFLRTAIIAVLFYPGVAGQLGGTVRLDGVEHIRQYVTFPSDWSAWLDDFDNPPFKQEDCRYVFVSRVDCFIHSDTLRRIGCAIVDCPGLFASSWDSHLAINTLSDAQAVLYMFGGNKAIGTEDIDALRNIRTIQFEDKIFYAFNSHISRKQTAGVISESEAKLSANGFQLCNGGIMPFHALLGLYSRNEQSLNTDAAAKEKFIASYQANFGSDGRQMSVQEMRDDAIAAAVSQYIGYKEAGVKRGNDELYDLSGLSTIIGKLENYSLKKKGYILLGTDGAVKLLTLLNAKKTAVEQEIKILRQESDAAFDEYIEQKKKLLKLIEESRKIVEEEMDGRADYIQSALADDLASRLLGESFIDGFGRDLSRKIADDIMKNKSSWLKSTGRTVWNKVKSFMGDCSGFASGDLEDRIKPMADRSLQSYVKNQMEAWISSIRSGGNSAYQSTIGTAAAQICREISRKSRDMDFAFSPISVADLRMDGLSGAAGAATSVASFGVAGAIGSVIAGLLTGVMVAKIVVSIVATIALGIDTMVLALPVAIVGGLVAIFSGKKAGTALAAKLFEHVLDKVSGSLRGIKNDSNLRNKVSTSAREPVCRMMDGVKNYFEQQFDNTLKKFEADWKKWLAAAAAGKAEKEARIKVCQDFLEQSLTPLIADTEKFIGDLPLE